VYDYLQKYFLLTEPEAFECKVAKATGGVPMSPLIFQRSICVFEKISSCLEHYTFHF
jgi:hypothetical protein